MERRKGAVPLVIAVFTQAPIKVPGFHPQNVQIVLAYLESGQRCMALS